LQRMNVHPSGGDSATTGARQEAISSGE